MNTTFASLIVFGCLVGAILLGRALRRLLPEDHLTADSRDTIKLAMGLVATMTALVLGLLVSSAKGAYDTKRSEVIQMAAKVALLDRLFGLYGLEAAEARAGFHAAVEEAVWQMWPEEGGRRRAWLPTRKRAMSSMAPLRASRHTMTRSASSKKRP